MEEKRNANKQKEITSDWFYDSSCTATSLPVWELQNVKLFDCCDMDGAVNGFLIGAE